MDFASSEWPWVRFHRLNKFFLDQLCDVSYPAHGFAPKPTMRGTSLPLWNTFRTATGRIGMVERVVGW